MKTFFNAFPSPKENHSALQLIPSQGLSRSHFRTSELALISPKVSCFLSVIVVTTQ